MHIYIYIYIYIYIIYIIYTNKLQKMYPKSILPLVTSGIERKCFAWFKVDIMHSCLCNVLAISCAITGMGSCMYIVCTIRYFHCCALGVVSYEIPLFHLQWTGEIVLVEANSVVQQRTFRYVGVLPRTTWSPDAQERNATCNREWGE